MKKKIILILAIIFLSFIFYIFYKSLYKKNYYVPQNISEKIISFKAKNLYTNNYLNSDQLLLDKKFTVINIWASWCLPCINEHKYLKSYCEKKKIDYLCTPFSFKSADILEKEIKINVFKLGSGELTNLPLQLHIARKKKPTITKQ